MDNEDTGVTVEDTPRERPANVTTSDGPPAASTEVETTDDDQTTDNSAKSDTKQSDGEETTGKPKRGNRSSSRKITRLTRRVAELTEQTEQMPAMKAKLESLESELELLQQTSKGATKPKREDHTSDEAYAEAFSDWKTATSKPVKKDPPAKKTDTPAHEISLPPEAIEIMDQGSEDYGEDWDEAMDSKDGIPINQNLSEYLFELEDPELSSKVIMHLHNDRKLAKELHLETMGSPRKATRALDKLLNEIKSAKPSKQKEQKGKKGAEQKQPPTPPNHEKTGGQDDVSAEISGNESMDDYVAKRRAQEKSKLRR